MADLDNDDEDLRRAIALSLQEEPKASAAQGLGSSASAAISLDSDDEEPQPQVKDAPKTASASFLDLDRKRMERDRLARRRKASISPPPPRMKSAGRFHSKPSPSYATIPTPPSLTGPVFLQGACKKTWAFGHPRQGDDIKIEEILQKTDLQLAVLSSFQWDIPWLVGKINLRETNVTLVMQAKDQATKQQYTRGTAGMPNLRLCFPSMEGQINCMHSKLMLLSHPTYLRLVVPTANLVSYDWGETGVMENMVFIVDLPRLPSGERVSEGDLPFFGQELIYFLNAKGLEKSIVDSLYNFDFSATAKFAFLHTIGGVHTGKGEPWRRTGYCGLGRAVQELGLSTTKKIDVDFVTSSVGALNLDFLSTIYLACLGDDGITEYEWRNPLPGKNKMGKPAQTIQDEVKTSTKDHMRIYFPTHETVRSSTAGSAGTVCFQSKWFESPKFPRHMLRDCKSVRPGLLMHNKILFVRPREDQENPDNLSTAWAYVGSANCSESAWGKLFKDRVSKDVKLSCRNWECGVLIPARPQENTESIAYREQPGAKGSLDEFEGMVPVPMQSPGEEYGDRKPWYFLEQR